MRKQGFKGTPEYGVWMGMRARCRNPNGKFYHHYGGRGIKVCERWDKFENFLTDMGPRPSPDHSLDRINNDGNYEPGNCRWATRLEQQRNRSNNHVLTFNGKSQPASAWAAELGMDPKILISRLHLGWTTARALTFAVTRSRKLPPKTESWCSSCQQTRPRSEFAPRRDRQVARQCMACRSNQRKTVFVPKRTNRWVCLNGERVILSAAARALGLSPGALRWKIQNGSASSLGVSESTQDTTAIPAALLSPLPPERLAIGNRK